MSAFLRKCGMMLTLLSLFAALVTAQTSEADFRKFLREKTTIDDNDLSEIDRGNTVVKALSVTDKQEVAIIGIVRIADLRVITLEEFRKSLSQKGNSEVDAKGAFKMPPSAEDLSGLELEDRDFKELQKCTVGDCDLNMSATWIKRFNSEIDWNAPDHRQKATALFREMLLQYLRDYSTKGAASLGDYSNRKEVVSLPDSHRTLDENNLFLKQYSNGLFTYLSDYPKRKQEGMMSELLWSTIDFGLNPTITLSHAVAYTNEAGNHFVATRQFYSSRYLDASLSMTMMLRFADGAAYIVFSDRSRSDALEGIFHGMSKRVVENEALERVKNVLKNAELRLITPRDPTPKADPPAAETGSIQQVLSWLRTPFGLITALAVLLLIVFAARKWIFGK